MKNTYLSRSPGRNQNPNKEKIEQTAKMLGDDKALHEYIKAMDDGITKERNRLLNDKKFIKKAEAEIIREGNEVDDGYIKNIALRQATIASPLNKAAAEIKIAGSKFWERAAEAFKSIGCTSLAEKCTARHEKVHARAIDKAAKATNIDSLKNALKASGLSASTSTYTQAPYKKNQVGPATSR